MRLFLLVATAMFMTQACVSRETDDAVRALPTWTIAPMPSMSIGGESEVDPLYQVGGVARIESGYLIANRSADEVRHYDFEGALLTRFGREGSGPHEFRNPRIVGALPADTIVVYDSSNDRISLLCGAAGICLEWPIRHYGQVVGITRDLTVLQAEVISASAQTGVERRPFNVFGVSRVTGSVDTIAALQSQPRQVGVRDDNTFVMPVPFMRSPLVAVGGEAIVVANGRDPELRLFRLGQSEPQLVELPIEMQPVTQDEVRAAAIAMAGPMADAEPAVKTMIASLEPPEFRPPIRRLLFDRSDRIWVELDQDDRDRHDWLVVDRDGTLLARVTTPNAVEVREVGDDYVIGVAQDSMDVEFVQLYALERN